MRMLQLVPWCSRSLPERSPKTSPAFTIFKGMITIALNPKASATEIEAWEMGLPVTSSRGERGEEYFRRRVRPQRGPAVQVCGVGPALLLHTAHSHPVGAPHSTLAPSRRPRCGFRSWRAVREYWLHLESNILLRSRGLILGRPEGTHHVRVHGEGQHIVIPKIFAGVP